MLRFSVRTPAPLSIGELVGTDMGISTRGPAPGTFAIVPVETGITSVGAAAASGSTRFGVGLWIILFARGEEDGVIDITEGFRVTELISSRACDSVADCFVESDDSPMVDIGSLIKFLEDGTIIGVELILSMRERETDGFRCTVPCGSPLLIGSDFLRRDFRRSIFDLDATNGFCLLVNSLRCDEASVDGVKIDTLAGDDL